MKRRNQKVILKHSQEHSSKLQVLSLWRHRICSLSNCPQRANQEIILLEGFSEGEQGSFTNVCREAAEKMQTQETQDKQQVLYATHNSLPPQHS